MLGPSQHLTHSDLLAQILTTLKKVEYLQYRPGYQQTLAAGLSPGPKSGTYFNH